MYSLLPNKEAPRKEGPDHKEEEEEEEEEEEVMKDLLVNVNVVL